MHIWGQIRAVESPQIDDRRSSRGTGWGERDHGGRGSTVVARPLGRCPERRFASVRPACARPALAGCASVSTGPTRSEVLAERVVTTHRGGPIPVRCRVSRNRTEPSRAVGNGERPVTILLPARPNDPSDPMPSRGATSRGALAGRPIGHRPARRRPNASWDCLCLGGGPFAGVLRRGVPRTFHGPSEGAALAHPALPLDLGDMGWGDDRVGERVHQRVDRWNRDRRDARFFPGCLGVCPSRPW